MQNSRVKAPQVTTQGRRFDKLNRYAYKFILLRFWPLYNNINTEDSQWAVV